MLEVEKQKKADRAHRPQAVELQLGGTGQGGGMGDEGGGGGGEVGGAKAEMGSEAPLAANREGRLLKEDAVVLRQGALR